MNDVSVVGTGHWRSDHQMLRIHCPTNGDVRDIQITIDDKVVSLGDNVSYCPERNDVLIPLKKTYVHRDISELVVIMKELSQKQDRLADLSQSRHDMVTEKLDGLAEFLLRQQMTQNKRHKWVIKAYCGLVFLLLVLIGGVAAILFNVPEIINHGGI